jgi:hypothetical protein
MCSEQIRWSIKCDFRRLGSYDIAILALLPKETAFEGGGEGNGVHARKHCGEWTSRRREAVGKSPRNTVSRLDDVASATVATLPTISPRCGEIGNFERQEE